MKDILKKIKTWKDDILHVYTAYRPEAVVISVFFLVLGIVLGTNAS